MNSKIYKAGSSKNSTINKILLLWKWGFNYMGNVSMQIYFKTVFSNVKINVIFHISLWILVDLVLQVTLDSLDLFKQVLGVL